MTLIGVMDNTSNAGNNTTWKGMIGQEEPKVQGHSHHIDRGTGIMV